MVEALQICANPTPNTQDTAVFCPLAIKAQALAFQYLIKNRLFSSSLLPGDFPQGGVGVVVVDSCPARGVGVFIVIEDIDCSVSLTNCVSSASTMAMPGDPSSSMISSAAAVMSKSFTLSGLLNFTDGLWSCCGSERIFVFTTNHIEKLDSALLRSWRMDMHINMSYCSFPALKTLMRNYLGMSDDELAVGNENDSFFRELKAPLELRGRSLLVLGEWGLAHSERTLADKTQVSHKEGGSTIIASQASGEECMRLIRERHAKLLTVLGNIRADRAPNTDIALGGQPSLVPSQIMPEGAIRSKDPITSELSGIDSSIHPSLPNGLSKNTREKFHSMKEVVVWTNKRLTREELLVVFSTRAGSCGYPGREGRPASRCASDDVSTAQQVSSHKNRVADSSHQQAGSCSSVQHNRPSSRQGAPGGLSWRRERERESVCGARERGKERERKGGIGIERKKNIFFRYKTGAPIDLYCAPHFPALGHLLSALRGASLCSHRPLLGISSSA
ncbi:hypothetical protein KSP40_PGU000671 [Platanthera guangdongensis]|uniref:ATPase AAA-type core domain-containing protein n=1 Tax=Platanthera guangdongensis TaxID=2320717 RepID=A0ABR2LKY1_9ASPA